MSTTHISIQKGEYHGEFIYQVKGIENYEIKIWIIINKSTNCTTAKHPLLKLLFNSLTVTSC